MNNASQFLNDLSTLNDDFSQAANYRQSLTGQAKAAAEAKISDLKRASNTAKSMIPHLKMLAGEEFLGGASAPHSVQQARGAFNWARGKLLSDETNATLDRYGQSSFDQTVGRIPEIPGALKSAGRYVAGRFRGTPADPTDAPVYDLDEGVQAAPLTDAPPPDVDFPGMGSTSVGRTPIPNQTIDNTATWYGKRPGTFEGRTLKRRPSFNRNTQPEGKDESKEADDDIEQEGKEDMPAPESKTGGIPGEDEEVLNTGAGTENTLTSAAQAGGESLDDSLGAALTTGATTGESGATAAAGAGGAAADVGADVGVAGAAAGDAAAAGELGEVAATNWWNAIGCAAALGGIGTAIASGVEALDEGHTEHSDAAQAAGIRPQIPNMPSFAGRYVIPVQSAIQNE